MIRPSLRLGRREEEGVGELPVLYKGGEQGRRRKEKDKGVKRREKEARMELSFQRKKKSLE